MDLRAVPRGEDPAVGVEVPGADPKCGAGQLPRPCDRPKPCEQLIELERLHEVVVRAGVEARHPVRHGAEGGQHQDRGSDPFPPKRRDEADAVQLRQSALHHEGGERSRSGESRAGSSIGSHGDVVRLAKLLRDQRTEPCIILDEQHRSARTPFRHAVLPISSALRTSGGSPLPPASPSSVSTLYPVTVLPSTVTTPLTCKEDGSPIHVTASAGKNTSAWTTSRRNLCRRATAGARSSMAGSDRARASST